jgi:hypothetical protein
MNQTYAKARAIGDGIMTKNALVFSGRNGLDFIELRQGVVRIPEVTLRLREAQAIFDRMEGVEIDLLSMICSDDELFFKNIQLKSLLSAIVQVGLFDRYCKSQKRPDFMVGNSNGDSALLVCAGRLSFQAMVEASQALSSFRPTERTVISLVAVATPLLSGLSLTEYHALETKVCDQGALEYHPMKGSSMELRKLIASLNQDQNVARFINIGPASALRGSDYRNLGSGDIESLDSIELDPMLGWFWRNVRPQAVALAQ